MLLSPNSGSFPKENQTFPCSISFWDVFRIRLKFSWFLFWIFPGSFRIFLFSSFKVPFNQTWFREKPTVLVNNRCFCRPESTIYSCYGFVIIYILWCYILANYYKNITHLGLFYFQFSIWKYNCNLFFTFMKMQCISCK